MSAVARGAAGPEVTRLLLPEPLKWQILTVAGRAAPKECCGLLTGRIEASRALVSACIESPNRAADPRTGFEIDPGLLLETQRRLRAMGECVLGHYHSHPRGPSGPSQTDRERAWVPGHIWLIATPVAGSEEARLSAHLAVKEKGGVILRPLRIEQS